MIFVFWSLTRLLDSLLVGEPFLPMDFNEDILPFEESTVFCVIQIKSMRLVSAIHAVWTK